MSTSKVDTSNVAVQREANTWSDYGVVASMLRQLLAERDAALVALKSCAEWMYDPDSSVDCFERINDLYMRETGYMRPGKDSVLENSCDDENYKRFGDWCTEQQRKRLAVVRAALSATGET